MRFINGKKKLIPRLVRIFGNNSLEEILGYQVNIAMLQSLRFHGIRRVRLKKYGGRIGVPLIPLERSTE